MAAGMSQSFSLPEGMNEALQNYKEALKEAKAELRNIEREAIRTQKSGGAISPTLAGRLDTARTNRDRLENLAMQQRTQYSGQIGSIDDRSRGKSKPEEMNEFLRTLMSGSVGGYVSYIKSRKIFSESAISSAQQLANDPKIRETVKQQMISGNMGFGHRVMKEVGLSARSLGLSQEEMFTVGGFSKAAAHAAATKSAEAAVLATAKISPRAAIGMAQGIMATSNAIGAISPIISSAASAGARSLPLIGTTYAAITAARGIFDTKERLDAAKFASEGSTADMWRNFFLTSTQLPEVQDETRREADKYASKMKEKYIKSNWGSRASVAIYGSDQGAIALEDRSRQHYINKQNAIRMYGPAIKNLLENVDKDRRTQIRAGAYKHMGTMNWINNKIWDKISGDENAQLSEYGIGFTEVQNAINLSKMEVEESLLKTWDTDIVEEIKLFNNNLTNGGQLTYALKRIDAHERTNAIEAYNKDILTRGLIWSN